MNQAQVNATPPADFPHQVIIFDKEFGVKHYDKAFYLRISNVFDNNVDVIELDGIVSLPQARKMAADKGYSPTHLLIVGESRLLELS